MSYTIEYDRQFIRSELGITPVWLSGDNNVTTGFGQHERRIRNWKVFLNMLACTKEELLIAVESMKGGYQEHWKKGGKWVDDAGLTRWVENGCKAAASIEDIISRNRLAWVDCSLLDCSDGGYGKPTHEEKITTTEEFDAWVQKVKPLVSAGRVYPIVSFNSGEPIKHPTATKKADDEKVIFKWKKSYLVALDTKGGSARWKTKPDEGEILLFTQREAEDLLASVHVLSDAKIVSAKVMENPCNIVLMVTGHGICGHYVTSISGHSFCHSGSLSAAKRYSTLSSARKAAANIKNKFGDVEVGILTV